jgi:hypothetical protein
MTPTIGSRVLAFHPEARAWRPATVRAVPGPGLARVHFAGYAIDDGSGQAGGPSEFEVRVPEELEALDAAADFLAPVGEGAAAEAWRGILHSLAAHDPRVYGERRAAARFDPASLPDRDLYALLVAAMLDADERIPGGAALLVRLRPALGDCDPRRLAAAGEAEVALARALMPSPLRARVLFSNARRFLELDAAASGGGGFRGWLSAQPDPVAALCSAFDRLEPRAAVLFLRYLGHGTIAADEALTRVAQRLGLVRHRPPPPAAEVRDAWLAVAREVGDAPALLDLTVRRFADAVCAVEPRCAACAVPSCPARRAESDMPNV